MIDPNLTARLAEQLAALSADADLYSLTVPDALSIVQALAARGNSFAPAAEDEAVNALFEFYIKTKGANGNLKPWFWSSPEGQVLSRAAKILYGFEYVDHTDAVAILSGIITTPDDWPVNKETGLPVRTFTGREAAGVYLHDKLLFNSHVPAGEVAILRSYFDPDVRLYRHGFRLRRSDLYLSEVRDVWNQRSRRGAGKSK